MTPYSWAVLRLGPPPRSQERILKGPIRIGGLTLEESGAILKPSGAITEMKESLSVRMLG